MSSSSSPLSSLPPVVPQHCLSVPLLYELVRGEEELSRIWLRAEMYQITDPLIDSLFHGLIMSSSSSAVPQSRLTVSELCGLLEGQKVEMRKVLKGEMDRVVNSLFDRLTNKLRTNEDGGDRAQVDQVESHNAQSHQVKREIEKENVMELKNMVDKATQTNELIEDCVKQEIKEEDEDGDETRLIDIEGLAENNQSGADDESLSGKNAPMDWVKQEIKEEEEDGQMMDFLEEEEEDKEGETNEVDLDNANEGDEADEVNRMLMNNLNGHAATDIDTLFDRSMRDEFALDDETTDELSGSNQTQNRDMSNASTSSNEPSNQNSTNLVDEEGQVMNNIQRQFDEANENGGIDEVPSRRVKRPRMDTTRPNNAQQRNNEVIRESSRPPTGEAQPNQVNKQFITVHLQCPQSNCLATFPEEQLNQHMREKHLLGPSRCLVKECGQSFDNSYVLRDHIKQAHQHTSQWHCDKCSKHFAKYAHLSIHNLLDHQQGHFNCSFSSCPFTGECRRKMHSHSRKHKRQIGSTVAL